MSRPPFFPIVIRNTPIKGPALIKHQSENEFIPKALYFVVLKGLSFVSFFLNVEIHIQLHYVIGRGPGLIG